MGIVPLWGLQMLIAIALSIVFKFNKVLVLIAANISFPPLIPLIIYLSHLTGKIWMGKNAVTLNFDNGFSMATVESSLLQYFLGGVSLALIAGLLFGGITYMFLKLRKRSSANG